jgi:hypothetical protein
MLRIGYGEAEAGAGVQESQCPWPPTPDPSPQGGGEIGAPRNDEGSLVPRPASRTARSLAPLFAGRG